MGQPFMDFNEFNLREGSKVGVKTVGGKLFYGTISHIEQDKATGEIHIDVRRWDDVPPYVKPEEFA